MHCGSVPGFARSENNKKKTETLQLNENKELISFDVLAIKIRGSVDNLTTP